jgi:aerobic-type carbon monoxide dehydrogenase small subunit (CoxS/CutS family)
MMNITNKSARGDRKRSIHLVVNGKPYKLEVESSETLAQTLRETLGLTGTKVGCDHGACGACTVIADGAAILSCMTLTADCSGKSILTIEGLEGANGGGLHPLQQAFIDNTAFQCGFCTPGTIMSAKALLDENPTPTEEDIKQALAGHYCRCISHYFVIKAVKEAAEKMSQEYDE